MPYLTDLSYLGAAVLGAAIGVVLGLKAPKLAKRTEVERAAVIDKRPVSRPTSGQINDLDKLLWDHAEKQDEYIVTQFGVAIIGIGALFFAFGELKGQRHFQELVALIGLAASTVVWMHSWGTREESHAFRDAIADDRLNWVVALKGWRHKGGYPVVYYPVTRLIVFFAGLVALAWLNLILWSGFSWDFTTLFLLDTGALAAVLVYAVTRHVQEIRDFRARDREKGLVP